MSKTPDFHELVAAYKCYGGKASHEPEREDEVVNLLAIAEDDAAHRWPQRPSQGGESRRYPIQ